MDPGLSSHALDQPPSAARNFASVLLTIPATLDEPWVKVMPESHAEAEEEVYKQTWYVLPRARLEIVPGAGHMLTMEQPERLRRVDPVHRVPAAELRDKTFLRMRAAVRAPGVQSNAPAE